MPVEFDYERLLSLDSNHLASSTAVGLNSDGTKSIVYEVPLGAGEGARRWLQSNRKTVKDAVVDHQSFDGTWRSIEIESNQSASDKNRVRLVQMFKKGWITTLVSGSSPIYTEARLVNSDETDAETVNGDGSGSGNNGYPTSEASNPQEYHLIRWEGIDPTKINTVAQSLRDLTSTTWAPTINGEALGTAFVCLKVIDTIDRTPNNNDKSGTIDVLLAKPRFNLLTWENYGTPAQQKKYYLNDVPVQLAQSINNVYTKRTGSSCRAGQPNERGLVSLEITDAPDSDTDDSSVSSTSCQYFLTTTFYHSVSGPVDVPENAMGITYRSRFDLIRNTGLYSGFIEKRQRQTIHVEEYRVEDANDRYTTEESWSGLYLVGGLLYNKQLTISGSSVTEESSTEVTLPANGSVSAGVIHNVTKRPNDDCTLDVTVRKRYLTESTASYDTHDDQDRHDSVSNTVNKDKSSSVTLTAGANEVLRAQVRYNSEFDTLDVSEVTSTSKDRDIRETEASAARTITRAGHTSNTSSPADASPEVGKIKRTRYEDSVYDGRYQTTEEEITAVDQTAIVYEENAAASVTSTLHTQGSALSQPTQTDGYIKRNTNRPTEYGLYATEEYVAQVVDQTGSVEQDRHDRSTSTTTHTQGSELAAPTAAAGTIVNRRSSPTQAGLYDTSDEVITAKNQTGNEEELSAARTVSRSTNTQVSAVSTPTQADGYIKRVMNRPTEFGLNSTVSETITAIDQTGDEYETSGARSIVRSTHTQGSALPQPSQTAGYIHRAANQPTEFGLNRTVYETIEAIDQTATDYRTTADQSAVATKHTQGTALTAPPRADGTIVRRTNRPTEFDKTETVDEVITAVNQQRNEYEKSAARTVSRDTNTQGTELAEPTQTDGVIKRTVSRATEFGKSQTVLETVTAIDQTGSTAEDRHDRSSSGTTHTQDSELTTPTAADGTIVRRRSTPTEFGKFDTVDETITAKNQTGNEVAINAARTITRTSNTQGDALTTPGQVDGQTNRISNSPTEFGKNATVSETIVANDQISYGYDETAARTTTRTKHTQGPALSQPTQVDGYIKTNTNTPTEFGLYATEEVVSQVVDQTSNGYVDSFFATVDTSKHTENAAEEPDVPHSTGVVTTVNNTPTESGLYRTTKEIRTAKAQKQTYTFQNQYGTCHVIWARNQPRGSYQSDVGTYSALYYTISGGAPSINEYGLEDYVIVFELKESGAGTTDTTFISSSFDYDTRVERFTVVDRDGNIKKNIKRNWYSVIAKRVTQLWGAAWNELESWDNGTALGMTHTFDGKTVKFSAHDRKNPESIPIREHRNANDVKLYVVTALYTQAHDDDDAYQTEVPT